MLSIFFGKKGQPHPPFVRTLLRHAINDLIIPVRKVQNSPIVIDPTEIRVWMIGHATVLINFFGTTIVTDPIFVNWIPFPRRLVAPGYRVSELPAIDVVLVSHPHFDHFNRKSLRELAPKTKHLVIPRQSADLVRDMPFGQVHEVDWDERLSIDSLGISAWQPEHWGRRLPWERHNRGFNSYVLEKNGRAVFFAGDTGYGSYLREVGRKHKIDVAILPIGAYKPAHFRQVHMDPFDAWKAFVDVKATHCVPMHWGTFRLGLEPINEPPKLLSEAAAKDQRLDAVHVIKAGESWGYTA